jgi:glycosyltransferase involved in cell wall biosynthesis
MRILIATDAFPPTSGGSGWSTHELARSLRGRGHDVFIVRPRFGEPSQEDASFDGFDVFQPRFRAPSIPFVRNYFKNERLYAGLGRTLARIVSERGIDVVHGQHLLSGPAAVHAARMANVPSVCTIRDYWPLCYWSDVMLDPRAGRVCPGCSARRMIDCVRPRGGAAWPLGIPAIPYMRGNLARKQRALASADALIAVSRRMASDLRARSPVLAASRIEVIPNPVDVAGVRAEALRVPHPPVPEGTPYALFVGKLSPNKGCRGVLDVVRQTRLDWPLVVVGDGDQRTGMEAEARAAGLDVRFTGWLARPGVLGWLRHASVLVFPSTWPEPLSRVLLEAAALGLPIAAMDTGGTGEIVDDGRTGLLARDVDELAGAVARLRRDPDLRARLGRAAEEHALARFDSSAVVARVESLYADVIAGRVRRR